MGPDKVDSSASDLSPCGVVDSARVVSPCTSSVATSVGGGVGVFSLGGLETVGSIVGDGCLAAGGGTSGFFVTGGVSTFSVSSETGPCQHKNNNTLLLTTDTIK